jgi:RNA polymerase sigma-70 factor (ECF subfamily)
MNTDPPLPEAVRAAWHRFADTYEPLRGELYRYCRHLTRSPWDAEDLAQETMARAFATLGHMGVAPPRPRAWLFRVASNLWLDHVRRAPLALEPPVAAAPPPIELRDAAGTLLVQLAPQERAAVVLKDAFDFPLEDIAAILATTTGAVKAALHRGRGKLVEPDPEPARVPTRAAVDAFCAAFNAHDVARLTALLLEGGTVEIVGATTSYDADETRDQMVQGILFGSRRMANAATQGGMEARFVAGVLPTPPRAEVRVHRGEALLLSWYAHEDGEHVRAISRFVVHGDRIAILRNYFFTPEVIAEICSELGVSSRPNGHRWWLSREGCP